MKRTNLHLADTTRHLIQGVNRRHALTMLGGAALASAGLPLAAQTNGAADYPAKVIKIVNPYAAGSSVDVIGRLIAERLRTEWSQPIVVENRTGAGGTVGAAYVSKAPPDGYTLFVSVTSPLVVAPWVMKRLPYNAETDLVPVWAVLSGGLALVTRNGFPAKSLQEFVAYLKANPGQVKFGSAGPTSPQHLSAELFMSKTGTKMIHVPYQGAVPAMTDLIGGHVDVMFDAIQHVLPHVRAGKIVGVAMLRPQRPQVLPELKTAAEQGVSGVETPGSVGLYAPRGTSAAILQKLETTINRVMNDPGVTQKLLDMGMTAEYVYGKDFADRLVQERVLFGQIVKDAGIQPQ